MYGAVTEPSEHVVELPVGNHLTANFLTGRCPFDIPCAESMSRTSSVATWPDDRLSTEQAYSKREACTSSTPRNSDSSDEQAAYATTTYGLIDLIPIHQSIFGPSEGTQPCAHSMVLLNQRIDQSYVPHHVSAEENVFLGTHMGVLDPPESCISMQGKEDDCAPGENRDSNDTPSRGSKAFACPYFRFDPIRHIDCLSRKLNRIQDVKQHLARRHHSAQIESQKSEDNIEGVSPGAQKALKVRVDRRLSSESQWDKIWDILFKITGPALGPYLGKPEEEIIGIALEICRKWGGEAVSRFLIQKGLSVSGIRLFQNVMEELLESLGNCSEEQPSGSGLKKPPEIPPEQTLNKRRMHTQAYCDSPNPPKQRVKGDNQQTFIAPSQLQSPSVKNDSLLLHELPGLEGWGSISERLDFTLYNESNDDEMPILRHFGEPDRTFNESPSNSTGYNSLASATTTPESGRCSESTTVPSKKQRQAEPYCPSFRSVWMCHECAFINNFTSGRVCQNYPCQHQYYFGCCEAGQLKDSNAAY